MESEPEKYKEPYDIYKFIYPLAKIALNRKYDLEVFGEENILDEPAIYAANHIHAVDSFLLIEAFTEHTGIPMRFAVKKGYFDGTGVDDKGKYGRTAQYVMKHTLHIPIDREGADLESHKLFNEGVRRTLEKGESLGYHPEATRDNNGKLNKFHASIGRLVIEHRVPAVPSGLVYLTPSNRGKTKVELSFGTAFRPEEVDHLPYTMIPGVKNKASHIAQVLENRVAQQTGMAQTGTFAVLKKFRNPNTQE